MKNLKPRNGLVIIKTKRLSNDRTESGLYKDVTFDRHGKMMIYAEVMAADNSGTTEKMFEVIKGQPPMGDRDERVAAANYVLNNSKRHDVRVGDRVYFHYLTLEDPGNYLGREGEYMVFKVPMHDLFLSVRISETKTNYIEKDVYKSVHLHNQYVLGTPYWGEGWEEVEIIDERGKKTTVAGKVGSAGIVTETKDKPVENHAVITDIEAGIKPYSRHREVNPGDVVVITPNCEFVNEIEHQERWVFTHLDIMAVIRKEVTIPVADYVLIRLKDRSYEGNMVIDTTKLKLENEGWIESVGGMVDEDLFEKGCYVKFHAHGARSDDDEYALVREANIMMILKHAI